MHDIDSVKKRIITSMIAILLLIFALFGITYAYFTAKVKGNTNDKSVDVSAGKLKLIYGDGNGFIKVDKIQPGEVIKSKTFTVKNVGDGDIDSYEVILENVVNELKYYNDLTFELKCRSDMGDCNSINDVFPIYDNAIISNSIKIGETHTYTLTLTYHETNLDQSDDMDKNIEAKVNIRDSEFNYTKLNIYGNKEGLGTLVNEETNRFNGKYKVDIKSIGKNLFNYNKVSFKYIQKKKTFDKTLEDGKVEKEYGYYGEGYNSIYINTYESLASQIGKTVTVSFDLITGEDGDFWIYQYQENGIGIKFSSKKVTMQANETSKIKLTGMVTTLGTNSSYSRGEIIVYRNGYTGSYAVKNIQFEIGNKATNYEQYQEEIYSIYVDEPLRCIDSTCDYVDLVNKKVIRKVKDDNGTLSVLDTPTEEKIQVIDVDILSNRNITVEGATSIEQELDR